jgi:hypothetical protein
VSRQPSRMPVPIVVIVFATALLAVLLLFGL